MELTIFTISQAVIALVFAFFISDFRSKQGMQNFFDRRLLLLVKILYPVLFVGYLYVVFTMQAVSPLDWFALFVAGIAVWLVWKGKRDLGKAHTWAGYFLETPELVTSGMYAYTRNPMYSAIYLFILGAFLVVIQHAPLLLIIALSVPALGIAVFLAVAARKEAQVLREVFKEEFIVYEQQVSMFFITLKRESR